MKSFLNSVWASKPLLTYIIIIQSYILNILKNKFKGKEVLFEVTEEDIKAKFEDGTLKIEVPKKENKQIKNKKYIEIK
mgnify:CR=1 FL=1